MLASARLAMRDDAPSVGKGEIAITLKRAAPALGIRGTVYHIMDILLGLSKTQDWRSDKRPVVAISNEKLAQMTCRTERTVSRCLKRLVELNILAYRDSPTGRRFINRAADGSAHCAYGLDFSPARLRINELKQLAETFHAQQRAKKETRRAITRHSRAIIDALTQDPNDKQLETLKKIQSDQHLSDKEKAERLERLYREVLERFTIAISAPALEKITEDPSKPIIEQNVATPQNADQTIANTKQTNENNAKTSPAGDINVIPYNRTILNNSNIFCKTQWSEIKNNTPKPHDELLRSYRQTPNAKHPSSQEALNKKQMISSSGGAHFNSSQSNSTSIRFELIAKACVQFQQLTQIRMKTWNCLLRAVQDMRHLIGLSEEVWIRCAKKLDRVQAATILALIVEKLLRDPASITTPAAYFNALISRAANGELFLHKSFYGLIQQDSSQGDLPC